MSRRRFPRGGAAIAVAMVALFVALGGTVYAAHRLNGSSIRVRSMPGNRLKPHSVGADRLKPGVLGAAAPAGPITGSQIDERSLGQVPSADYADSAGTALTAIDAQTAANAINAIDADTVNGHGAGCRTGTVPFAGACWQASASEAAATAVTAATACAVQGGSLPEAFELAAFSQQRWSCPQIGEEWSGGSDHLLWPECICCGHCRDRTHDQQQAVHRTQALPLRDPARRLIRAGPARAPLYPLRGWIAARNGGSRAYGGRSRRCH